MTRFEFVPEGYDPALDRSAQGDTRWLNTIRKEGMLISKVMRVMVRAQVPRARLRRVYCQHAQHIFEFTGINASDVIDLNLLMHQFKRSIQRSDKAVSDADVWLFEHQPRWKKAFRGLTDPRRCYISLSRLKWEAGGNVTSD